MLPTIQAPFDVVQHAAQHASMGRFDYVKPSGGVAPTKTFAGIPLYFRSNGAPVVASGNFLSSSAGTGQRAWYSAWQLPGPVTRMGAEFSFTAGSGGLNGAINITPWSANIAGPAHVPPTGMHFTINRWGWSADTILVQDGPVTNYAAGAFKTPLSVGVVYTAEVALDISNSRAFLRLPDGSVQTISNAAIGSIAGTWPGFEFYQLNGSTDDIVSIGRTWASSEEVFASQAPAALFAAMDIPTKPTAVSLLSITSSTIGTSAALVDSTAVCPVNVGPRNGNVLCRLTAWVNVIGGHSIIFAPKFKTTDGTTLSQPYFFLLTAPTGGFSGFATLEFVQNCASAQAVTCELWAQSTAAGDTFTVAGNKPITMSFTPLG